MAQSADRSAERLSLVFSSVGHVFMHLFTAMFFTIALAMEKQGFLSLGYAELAPLWSLGALLVGVAAMPAGWLSDRWSAIGMMVVFFFGLGAAGVACGLADSRTALWIGLSAVGLFSAIYHPVGIPWVVKNATARGKALGVNGVFGVVGVAVAGVVAGVLSDLWSWRAAFLVPGILCLLAGVALLVCWRRGLVSEGVAERMSGRGSTSKGDLLRAFLVLTVCMTAMGLIFQGVQSALPKLFELRLGDALGGLFGEGASGPGIAVAIAYTVGGGMQLIGGHLVDRYPLKPIYVGSLFLQVLTLLLLAEIADLSLVLVAALSAALSAGALPAENMLIARYSPKKHPGLSFGAKYVLAFGTAPLAIWGAAWTLERTGGYTWFLLVLAGLAMIGGATALLLPKDKRVTVVLPQPQAAE